MFLDETQCNPNVNQFKTAKLNNPNIKTLNILSIKSSKSVRRFRLLFPGQAGIGINDEPESRTQGRRTTLEDQLAHTTCCPVCQTTAKAEVTH